MDFHSPEWEKVSDQNGIEGFRKSIPHRSIIAFKGIGVIHAPIAKVATILMDPSRKMEWLDRVGETRLVRKISELEYVEYSRMSTPPFFMRDRDFVVHFKAEMNPAQGSFILKMKSIEDPSVPETHAIRGEVLECTYVLKTLDEQDTALTFESYVEPKGVIPGWIVHMLEKDWPVHTIENLRKQADKPDVKENPFFQRAFHSTGKSRH